MEIGARSCVSNISEKISQTRLRWLGRVERKTYEDVVMRTWKWTPRERKVNTEVE